MNDVDVHYDNNETRVVATGDIDFAITDRFNAAIDDAFGSAASRIVIDLRDTTFFDSAGIAGLMRAHRLAEARHIELVVEPGPARRSIEVACVDHLLRIDPPSASDEPPATDD
jgi:anti-anti-sigma factor